jgi:hypothetical protein
MKVVKDPGWTTRRRQAMRNLLMQEERKGRGTNVIPREVDISSSERKA